MHAKPWWQTIAPALALISACLPLAVRAVVGQAGGQVHVRWQASLDPTVRQRLEARYRLADGRRLDATTWRYDLIDPSSDNIRALVSDPAAADTHDIDRPNYALNPAAVRTARRRLFEGGDVAVSAADGLAALLATLAALLVVMGLSGHAQTPRSAQLLVLRVIRFGWNTARASVAPVQSGRANTAALAASTWERVRRFTRTGSPLREVRADLLISLVCALAVTAPILIHGTPDEESYEFSVFSTLYFVKKLLAGGQPFFTPDFAFGVKIPNGQWFLRFPASLTAVFGSARVLYSSTWILGQLAFAFFFLRLLRYVSASRRVRVAAVVTAVLSFSNLGYFYIDDWPEVFLGWCLLPFCLWSSVALLEACRTGSERIGKMAVCAFAFGMLVGNAHPLHSFIWFTVLVLFFLPVLWATPSLFPVLAAVAGVAVLGALDIVVQTLAGLGSSHGTFNPLNDATARYPSLHVADYLGFLQPMNAVTESGWAGLLRNVYGRRPFYGVVFFVLALAGSVPALFQPQVFRTVPNRALVRAVGFAFLGTLFLTFAPSWVVFNLVGEGWHYKDGQTMFAILVAAMVLNSLFQRGWHKLATGLLVLQVIQAILVAGPIVREAVMNDRHLLFRRDVRRDTFWEQPVIASLRGGARVMAAGSLDGATLGTLSRHLREMGGVVAVTDFVLEDIAIVNGWYRGTVTPQFGPNHDPRYGAYQTVLKWSENLHHLDRLGLDALGITHVLAFASESSDLRDSLGLEEVGTVQDSDHKSPIAVLRNPRAWDRAVLIATGGPSDLAPRSDCKEPYVWCADFSRLATSRVPGTRVRRQGDTFIVELPPGHPGGYVLLTQVLADGWMARVNGEARSVRPFHDVFVAVDVRESDRVVELSYDSRAQALMLAAGVGQMALCLAVYAAFTLRKRDTTRAR